MVGIKIFCDAATLADIERYGEDSHIDGFTTNPSLMRKAGITDYRTFALEVIDRCGGKAVSFEVLADDWATMAKQAEEIQSWGDNVYVKIPITNTKGKLSIDLIDKLQDLNLNITAVMTGTQIEALANVTRAHHIISVFAGRIADTGVHPGQIILLAKEACYGQVLWASAREVYNVTQAEAIRCDIITLQPDLIAKLALRGKDLTQYSLETVQQFHQDGKGIML